ncbi:hypothetical protein OKW28_004703 [Paraburkholderia sp. 40]
MLVCTIWRTVSLLNPGALVTHGATAQVPIHAIDAVPLDIPPELLPDVPPEPLADVPPEPVPPLAPAPPAPPPPQERQTAAKSAISASRGHALVLSAKPCNRSMSASQSGLEDRKNVDLCLSNRFDETYTFIPTSLLASDNHTDKHASYDQLADVHCPGRSRRSNVGLRERSNYCIDGLNPRSGPDV